MKNRLPDRIVLCMKNVSLIEIMALSFLMAVTTQRICSSFGARDFLEELSVLPQQPWSIPLRALGLFAILLALMGIKREGEEKKLWPVLLGTAKILLCLGIMSVLQWNYSGLILLAAVDFLSYGKLTRLKGALLSLAFVMFLLLDFDIVSTRTAVISVDRYLSYYTVPVRNLFTVLFALLSSLNTLLFMVYALLRIRVQVAENERIRQLNAQLNEANEELKEMNLQLAAYAKETERMAETRERNRLAREIHDTLGHALTGIITGIDAAVSMLDYSVEGTRKQLGLVSEVARQGMTDVRRSVKALRPDALEKQELEGALRQIIGQAQATTGLKVEFDNQAGKLHFDSDEEEVLYRIVQESMTNAVRHGHADHLWIRMEKEEKMLHLLIRDNGKGCGEITDGFGLTHMKERIRLLGGSVKFDGSDGFCIDARIPIRWGDKE